MGTLLTIALTPLKWLQKRRLYCVLCHHTLDIGCFAPFKTAWRENCHNFCTSNPGQTVSRYDFCQLFATTWYQSFTMPNIINSFKATGVCPLNRMAVHTLDEEDFSASKPSTLPEKCRLAYIPLYSPARSSVLYLTHQS